MGPQHTRCGKISIAFSLYAFGAPLQWGHNILVVESQGAGRLQVSRTRFNGATTYSLWKVGTVVHAMIESAVLQWGHNILVVESLACSMPYAVSTSCFNGATTYSLWKGRGWTNPPRRGWTLQWGHNILVVESGQEGDRSEGGARSFNGATTYSLWKALLRYQHSGPALSLQWGHNILVVERTLGVVYALRVARLQWGHNILVVERSSPLPPHGRACTRFNGATTYSLWKARWVDSWTGSRPPASMGPQHTRCGKTGLGTPLPCRPAWLQWGHNILVVESGGAIAPGATIMWALQWGHNILVVERLRARILTPPVERASMGPQHTRCGKADGNVMVTGSNAASMGPQHTRCGKLDLLDAYNAADKGLQWGHNILVVESRTHSRTAI